jgi:4-carboxymuconolactone decarboxylase
MTRTPYLKPEEMSAEQREIYEAIVKSRGTWLNGPYAPMLLQPRLAEPAHRLGEFLRYHTSLGQKLTELAILVVARYWDSDFEWYQHAKIALRSEVPPEVIESIRQTVRPSSMNEDMEIVHDFARSLLVHHRVPEALYRRAQELLTTVGVVELTALIGYYTFIAFALVAHEVPLPAGVTSPLARPSVENLKQDDSGI